MGKPQVAGTLTIEDLNKPKLPNPIVAISPELWAKIEYIVNKAQGEVQWFHLYTKVKKDDNLIYIFTDLYIPEQFVSSSEADSSGELMTKLTMEIMESCKDENGVFDSATFNEISQSITVWCHSHVNMPTTPSGTDVNTFKQKIQDNPNLCHFMVIVNKSGSIGITAYDPEYQVIFRNIPIHVRSVNFDTTYIDEAFKNKIKTRYHQSTFKGNYPSPTSRYPSFNSKQSSSPGTTIWADLKEEEEDYLNFIMKGFTDPTSINETAINDSLLLNIKNKFLPPITRFLSKLTHANTLNTNSAEDYFKNFVIDVSASIYPKNTLKFAYVFFHTLGLLREMPEYDLETIYPTVSDFIEKIEANLDVFTGDNKVSWKEINQFEEIKEIKTSFARVLANSIQNAQTNKYQDDYGYLYNIIFMSLLISYTVMNDYTSSETANSKIPSSVYLNKTRSLIQLASPTFTSEEISVIQKLFLDYSENKSSKELILSDFELLVHEALPNKFLISEKVFDILDEYLYVIKSTPEDIIIEFVAEYIDFYFQINETFDCFMIKSTTATPTTTSLQVTK